MSWASIRRSRIAAILFSLVLGVSLACSQTGTSTIRGTITDPQSRPVASANVTLTNVSTNEAQHEVYRYRGICLRFEHAGRLPT